MHKEKFTQNIAHNSSLYSQWPIQNYFNARQLTCYFRVHDSTRALMDYNATRQRQQPHPQDGSIEAAFHQLKSKVQGWQDELEKTQAMVMVDRERTERVPWLHKLGLAPYLAGLSDSEIKSSYQVPQWRHLANNEEGVEDDIDASSSSSSDDRSDREDDETLSTIVGATKEMLTQAYNLVDEDSDEYRLTEQRAAILSKFSKDATSKQRYIFRAYKNPATLEKYFFTMQQLVAYTYRIAHGATGHFTQRSGSTVLPQDRIQLSIRQQSALKKTARIARRTKDIGNKTLHQAIITALERLMCDNLGSNKFGSPITSFAAMLARKHNKKKGNERGEEMSHSGWQDLTSFSSHLSALIWGGQLVLFRDICTQYEEDPENPSQIIDVLSEYMDLYFQQERETPFGFILHWRLLLFNLAPYAVTSKQARWAPDFSYIDMDGVRLHMRALRQLVCHTFQDAARILYQQLLFGTIQAGKLANVQPFSVEDSLEDTSYGTSWLDHAANKAYTCHHKTALLECIRSDPDLCRAFFRQDKGGAVAIHSTAMATYEADAQLFLGRLLVLCHIVPGPPLRAPEILSADTANTERMRHVYVWTKQVAIHVTYHKSQENRGKARDNLRFLPNEIGNLILLYVLYVLPLRKLLLQERYPNKRLSTRLWTDRKGEPWDDRQLTYQIKSACAAASVPILTSAWWRHIAAAMTKDLFTKQEMDVFGPVSGDDSMAEDQPDMVQLAEMSNHTFRTMSMAYAGSTGGLVTTMMHRTRHASMLWATRLQLTRALHDANQFTSQPMRYNLKRLGGARTRPAYSEADVLTRARRLYKNDTLEFRSSAQREAVRAICGDDQVEQVIVIMATGAGKTLPILTPSQMPGAGTTIIVVSTVALRYSLTRQMKAMSIRWEEWTGRSSPTMAPSVVIISAEAVSNTRKLTDYCWRLNDLGRLDRIVMDECHLTLTARYRESMGTIGESIRQIRTQSVWLTGTLMPSMEEDFIYTNKLVAPLIIRQSTNRPNIRYLIQIQDAQPRAKHNETGVISDWILRALDARMSNIARLIRDRRQGYNADARCIVYWPTVEQAKLYARRIGCAYVTGEQTNEEKASAIDGWLNGTGRYTISATSALGVGFDYSNIRAIIHAGVPRRLTDYSQESGRAGRDGERAISEILAEHDWEQHFSGGTDGGDDTHAMYLIMKKMCCVRGVMSQYLDSSADWLCCTEEQSKCWYCRGLAILAPRLPGSVFGLGKEMVHTGEAEILRQKKERAEAELAYQYEMEVAAHTCLYCRARGRESDHTPGACGFRDDWIKEKMKAAKRKGNQWMPKFGVCFRCYHPQFVCRAGFTSTRCELPDQVMPVCIGTYQRPGGRQWLKDTFDSPVESVVAYMDWLGQVATIGSEKAANCNRVAIAVLLLRR
ncbi:hypothetical protein PWT90_08516 [Aphanocladium album]|nr:hypothetical protein PWT90_08516 [Aphanocladium album]